MEQAKPNAASPQKWKYALQIEKKLEEELKKQDNLPRFKDVDSLIEELRIACETTIFLDFVYAAEQEVELRLWTAHSHIKDRYRRLISHLREKQPSRHVERRKLEQRYVDFIKTTQFYYKGYIQRLASHFGGMRDLRRVADRLSLNTQTADVPEQPTAQVKGLIKQSCHAALLRLGDLSRYRNDLRTKNRSWAPALGYYSLASDLCPNLGNSHNQMAVIALAEVNHLNAVYHLYRAIAVEHPHPLAEGNLEIEFKKIATAWEKSVSSTSGNNEATLILWFVRLHARFYAGVSFSGHKELENEVLSRVARLLKEQAFEETFLKLVLINIAAEFFAGERVKKEGSGGKDTTIDSFYFYLRFNIRFLSVLLQTIQPELEIDDTGEDLPGESGVPRPGQSRERITAVARRILPALRQYSLWLVSREKIILAPLQDKQTTLHAQEMLRVYASVLTKLFHLSPIEELPVVSYLLEEDEATLGFTPFLDTNIPPQCHFYMGNNGLLKPRSTDGGVERNHPNIEMKSRIRDIFVCALVNQRKKDFPVALNTNTLEFTFTEHSPASNLTKDGTPSTSTSPKRVNSRFKNPAFVTDSRQDINHAKSVPASDSHQSMDTDMHRMVDNLLEPSPGVPPESNETSYGMHTRTANEIFAPISRNGYQPTRINTQGILPSLPGIWNSPFTPQPNELAHHSPQHENAYMGRNISPTQLANAGQKAGMTSYRNTQSSSWGTAGSRQPSNSSTQAVNNLLQESLSQQFMPMSISSAFSSSSSIYANTPHGEQIPSGGGGGKSSLAAATDNNTTTYAGASDFDRNTMLQSSIWDNNSQPSWDGNVQTPPRGQGG